jgi:nucleotide-binding universal stress UspA family protein
MLPEDFLVRDGNTVCCVPSIHSDDEPVDIGVHSLAQLTNLMAGAYSILWVDSLGIGSGHPSSSDWEVMQQIFASIPGRWQHAVLAGNDLVASLSKSADASSFAHLTLFGDAAVEIIAGRKLAAVEALHVGGLRRNERSRKRVLVSVDGSAHAREAAGVVARYVDVENAEIHLLYVHASESRTAELRSDPNEFGRLNAEAKMASLPVFEQITAELGRYGLAPHHQVIRQGDPGEQILKYADDIDAELIVMGSHGRSDGLGLMLGSASQRVVDNAPCPVLVARIQSARNR